MTIERSNDTVKYRGASGNRESAEMLVSTFPLELLTDSDHGRPRLRVDPAQTGFWLGHQFRTFKEWDELFTGTYVIKATVPLNIILFSLFVELDAGEARIETLVGGTEGGTFGEDLPIIPANTMSDRPTPFYESPVTLEAGGTLTGGTQLDVIRPKTSDNSNFSSSVGSQNDSERGVGAGTYYFRLTLSGVTGVFRARWEDRP